MKTNHYAPPEAEVVDVPVPSDSRLAWISILLLGSSIATVVITVKIFAGQTYLRPFEYMMWAGVALLALSAGFGVAAFIQQRRNFAQSTPLVKWVIIQSTLALLVVLAVMCAFFFAPGLR